ncbi:alpha-ketoglutarate-dependent dioxygenase AlkB family protein [Psychroserpens algicola]|uniref:Alpha-ketoglutarate-dependent dioxygenase AlkB n=1 Tax=Psychroserpens algicola TaxID=1719034 RepID=A0ABT0H8M2_9FLAO|nr:alpha-ketoglutarate-dependent dioxygenase AlkB [Psychroserpens algicola]MCK8480190.1 alpha-ketoglutarate-dependent dioxygenase AlkB [Psychroserpens algicola]
MNLFPKEKTIFKRPNAELIYIENFYETGIASQYFNHFKQNINWQQDHITVFGKTYKQPRLTALYATNDKPYSYSGLTMQPLYFTKELLQIKSDVEQEVMHQFTTVLLNLYRNGNDSNGWHADNEKELGKHPIIASVSFGETRSFHFKHRHITEERHKINLKHGSLLIMKGEMQEYWLHQIPKTKKVIGERINLTFRTIL